MMHKKIKTTPTETQEKLVKEWEESGLTQKEFCKKKKLNCTTFGNWRRTLSHRPFRKRVPRSEEEKKEILREWVKSNQSMDKFCKERGLSYNTCRVWQRLLFPETIKKQDPNPKETWGSHVKAWEESGLTQKEFCKRKKLNCETFGNWRRTLSHRPFSKRVLRSEEEKKEILREWVKSNQPLREFCKERGLSYDTCRVWQKRIFPETIKKQDPNPKETWGSHLKAWEESGLPAAVFCKRDKLNCKRLYRWQIKLNKKPISETSVELKLKWERILEDWRKSRRTPEEYCKEKHVNLDSFLIWKHKKDTEKQKKEKRQNLRAKGWKDRILECQSLRLTPKVYCKQRNLSQVRFEEWNRRLFSSSEYASQTIEDWKILIEEWKESNLTPREFCKEKALPLVTFLLKKQALVSNADRKKELENEWKVILNNWKISSQTPQTYCEINSLPYSQFAYWLEKLGSFEKK